MRLKERKNLENKLSLVQQDPDLSSDPILSHKEEHSQDPTVTGGQSHYCVRTKYIPLLAVAILNVTSYVTSCHIMHS